MLGGEEAERSTRLQRGREVPRGTGGTRLEGGHEAGRGLGPDDGARGGEGPGSTTPSCLCGLGSLEHLAFVQRQALEEPAEVEELDERQDRSPCWNAACKAS